MADYKQTDVQGVEWTRCYQINIGNRRGEQPVVTFDEETVLALPDRQVVTGQAVLRVPFDPAAEFPIIDPVTYEPTEVTMTHEALYGLLFSAYLNAARQRDAANAPPAAPEPAPEPDPAP